MSYLRLVSTAPVAASEIRTPATRLRRGWRNGLPYLESARAVLRELKPSDAAALFHAMSRRDVTRFISPPPATLQGFEEFLRWAQRERSAGTHLCFGIIEPGTDMPVGIFQVRALEGGFRVSEWGFALAPEHWGTGLFVESARLALEFAFAELGVHRLEARAAIRNGRGNAALRKMGAVQEGVLRQSFFRNGQYMDQALWTILADDWLGRRREPTLPLFH
jgi:[ribosomal protein S5]-alanine N-acetyltransferase